MRRYVEGAQAAGLCRSDGIEAVDDGLIGAVADAVRPVRSDGHGSAWEQLVIRGADHRVGGVSFHLCKSGVVANAVVPTPDYVRLAGHYGFAPDFCHANDPRANVGLPRRSCGRW
ncbi:hypothetical protein [Mycobacterium sp. NPDC006124]|uniref:hypothetical protein n=1 Tax=Mycobacterium sp. NPDC006124 TaxID=3156729 RepID=UPI0033A227E6